MNSNTETKLQIIADALNSSADRSGDYNHYWHAVKLGEELGIAVDCERMDAEDNDAAYEIYFENGRELHLSCDEWCVGAPE